MNWSRKIKSQVLRQLAEQRRRVISAWRVLIEYRRIAHSEGFPLPSEEDAGKVLHALVKAKEITRIRGAGEVFQVDLPYAAVLPVSEEQVVQEANPAAVFSYWTALASHALTDQIPGIIHVTDYRPADEERIPLGTRPEEWVDLPRPETKQPKAVGEIKVCWTHTKGEWDFGHTTIFSQGMPIYVTDLERTLIDAIRSPDAAGGIVNVLRAWRQAKASIDVAKMVRYTERMNLAILRHRVGFLLDSLGLAHPRMQEWKKTLGRGGSVKLLAAAPYAPEFSGDWNLSLNVPPGVLNELKDENDGSSVSRFTGSD